MVRLATIAIVIGIILLGMMPIATAFGLWMDAERYAKPLAVMWAMLFLGSIFIAVAGTLRWHLAVVEESDNRDDE